jgi:hypothetical protein
MFSIEWEWAPASAAWIEAMPTMMTNAVRSSAMVAMRVSLKEGRDLARGEVTVFDGGLRDAIQYSRPSRSGDEVSGAIYVDNSTLVEDIDLGPNSISPYNYGSAKHSPGHGEHKVYLYNPKTGESTKGRQKLVKWLKANKGGRYVTMPDAPTREYFRTTKGAGAPFTTVDPSKTAKPYLSFLTVNNGDPLAGMITHRFFAGVREAWSK